MMMHRCEGNMQLFCSYSILLGVAVRQCCASMGDEEPLFN